MHDDLCPANPINCSEHMNDDYGHTARCTLSACQCDLVAEDSFEAGWNAAVEKCLEYMTRNGGCSAEAVINVRTLRV